MLQFAFIISSVTAFITLYYPVLFIPLLRYELHWNSNHFLISLFLYNIRCL